MSNSVALVAVARVATAVENEVVLSQKMVDHLVENRGLSISEARTQVLHSAVSTALTLTKNDEVAARQALVIVRGRINRLPQCTKLLRKHDSNVVSTAYELKDELSVADTSLRTLCQLVEMTDGDLEGEASKLRGLLDEVAMKAVSNRQRWYFNNRIREALEAGRLIEAVEDEILDELAQREEGEAL